MNTRKLATRTYNGVQLIPVRTGGLKIVVKFSLGPKTAVTSAYAHVENAFSEAVRRIEAFVPAKGRAE